MTGIEGFAWTVNPKSHLNGTTARCEAAADADGAGEPVAPGVQATTAVAAADMSAWRRVSRSWPMRLSPSLSVPWSHVPDSAWARLALRGVIFPCGAMPSAGVAGDL